jgi:pyruvate dehydrogenase E2 component (dihydrolipoamide acetyltransferase)
MYGIDHFNAIINPPQACILSVGGIIEKPVIKNGTVVPGKTITIGLSVDHRVIDGADAAMFLGTLKSIIENPILIGM